MDSVPTNHKARRQTFTVRTDSVNSNSRKPEHPCNQTFLTSDSGFSQTGVIPMEFGSRKDLHLPHPHTSSNTNNLLSSTFVAPSALGNSKRGNSNIPAFKPQRHCLSTIVPFEKLAIVASDTKTKRGEELAKQANRSAWEMEKNYSELMNLLIDARSEWIRSVTSCSTGDTILDDSTVSEELFDVSQCNVSRSNVNKTGKVLENLRLKESQLKDEIKRIETTTELRKQECKDYIARKYQKITKLAEEGNTFEKQQEKLLGRKVALKDKANEKVQEGHDHQFKVDLINDMIQSYLKVSPQDGYKCTDELFCREFHRDLCKLTSIM